MFKIVTAMLAALAACWVFAGSATSASAHYHKRGCCGGPIPPSYVYHTVHKYKKVTRYRDVSTYRHVTKYHPIIHVTRIQPIVHVTSVTRYHHHTVVHVKPTYEHVSQYLPPKVYVTHASTNTYDCRCVSRYHHCH